MNPKSVSIIVITSICCILLWIGIGWWRDNQKAALMEEIHTQEGIIQNLKEQLTKKAIEGNRLKQIADSAIAAIHPQDTVIIRENNGKIIYAVRNLGTTSSLEYLSNRLSKAN
jgi:uncharacterized membrane protein